MADVVVASTVLISIVRVPSLLYKGPTTVRTPPFVSRGRDNYLIGMLGKGLGRIRGTVKEKHEPSDTPVFRRVRLLRERDGMVVREQWSDRATGAYDFQWIDELETYTVISHDHTHNFRAVAADNLSLANGVVELMP